MPVRYQSFLRDHRRYKLGRGDVERVVERLRPRGGGRHRDLLVRAQLDRDRGAGRRRLIDGRLGHRDQERDAGPVRGEGQAEGADLVGHVAVRGDPVGPHHHGVGQPLADQERSGAIACEPVLDAELPELPAGQPGALQQGPGLVHDHVPQRPVGVQRADHPERRAPAQAGEAAGVAVGVDPERLAAAGGAQVGGAALADLVAGRGGELHHGQGRGLDGPVALRQVSRDRRYLTPEVDRGRPRVGDPLDLRVQPRAVPALAAGLAGGERHAERAGRAEHRRAPDGQPGNRVEELIHGGDTQDADLMRQLRLIQRFNVPVPPGEHVGLVHTPELMLFPSGTDSEPAGSASSVLRRRRWCR